MSATEELRRLLDERGIEWKGYKPNPWTDTTAWDVDASNPRREVEAGFMEFTDTGVTLLRFWNATPEQAIDVTLGREVTGETSDGFHTFNDLYHHRAVLFSVIVRDHRELAWKSMRHHDGTMYDGMFIVGIETPEGQATYHYDIDPYWDMFDCKELDRAPEWDGHTPDDAIGRIATLGTETCHADETETWQGVCMMSKPIRYARNLTIHVMECSACGHTYEHVNGSYEFCPRCGRQIVEVEKSDG